VIEGPGPRPSTADGSYGVQAHIDGKAFQHQRVVRSLSQFKECLASRAVHSMFEDFSTIRRMAA
jgi:hypothetical protein